MYGSATMIVLTTGQGTRNFFENSLTGVNGFTLDPSTGEFVLTHPKIQCPKKHNIYSINEGYWYVFDVFWELKAPIGSSGSQLSEIM